MSLVYLISKIFTILCPHQIVTFIRLFLYFLGLIQKTTTKREFHTVKFTAKNNLIIVFKYYLFGIQFLKTTCHISSKATNL